MKVTSTAGYASAEYAAALHHIGVPVCIGGAVLIRRPAPNGRTDLVAPYPLLRCDDWGALEAGLAENDADLTVSGVTDPFCDPGLEVLAGVFPDLVRPWKLHHVARLDQPSEPSSNHRRNLRKVAVDIVRADEPERVGDDLVGLYDVLRRRHAVTGPADFPADSLRAQLAVAGASAWTAHADGVTVGAVVTYTEGSNAWYHLGAATAEGYEARAMFGLFDAMLRDLRDDGVGLLDLGAGAGADEASAGLERFKRGWADEQRPTHLVGRVLDRDGTTAATAASPTSSSAWFPPYRNGVA